MRGQMWLSLFHVSDSGLSERPPGLYGVAFASYEEGSPLTYLELLVARLVDAPRRRLTITDIWVDSETSRQGGRSLWAIPKELAELELHERRFGPAARTGVTARAAGVPIADGVFLGLPGAALVRAPLRATTVQRRSDAAEVGAELRTPWSGSSRVLPAVGRWDFEPAGPLGFLHGRRCLTSFRLRDVRLRFG
jgi:hypothetical protein